MSKHVVLIRHNDGPADDRADDQVFSYFRGRGIEPELRSPCKGDALGAGGGI